jgi:hypothetical protein
MHLTAPASNVRTRSLRSDISSDSETNIGMDICVHMMHMRTPCGSQNTRLSMTWNSADKTPISSTHKWVTWMALSHRQLASFALLPYAIPVPSHYLHLQPEVADTCFSYFSALQRAGHDYSKCFPWSPLRRFSLSSPPPHL